MFRRYISLVILWLKRVVTQPRSELSRWQKTVRYSYELGRHGARQLRHDRAPQMAGALAFRALFGLLPALVVATILVRTLFGIEDFLVMVADLMAWAKLNTVRLVLPADASGGINTTQTLSQWLEGLITEAAGINLAAIGWIGLIAMIYASIGLMVTIENAFNIVYRAPQGRNWTRRIPLYWFVLTISPVALGCTVFLNNQFEDWIQVMQTWQWALASARVIWTVFCSWLFLFAVYVLIPNTRVGLRPAAIGAIVSALLLEIGKRTLGMFLENAFSIGQLYGSLGLIPLFMFWVYLMWLVVLFGLELSATLQTLRGRELDELEEKREPSGVIDPAAILTIMEYVTRGFQSGKPVTARHLSEETLIPHETVLAMVERLVQTGFLHRLNNDQETICLAKPAESISAEELMDVGFGMLNDWERGGESSLLTELRATQQKLAARFTLAELAQDQTPSASS